MTYVFYPLLPLMRMGPLYHKSINVVGFFAGVSTVLLSIANGIVGWPILRTALGDYEITSELLGWLHVMWLWASVALLAMGSIVLREAARLLRGKSVNGFAIVTIALTEIIFGLLAGLLFTWNSFHTLLLVLGIMTSFLLVRERGIGIGPPPDPGVGVMSW